MAEGWPKKRRILGTKVKRLDAPEKATGRAKYSYDVNRPGMLHGAILRSPHAHAKIKSLDTSAAKATPGLKALAMIAGARDGTVTKIDGDKLTYVVVAAGKKKGDKKEETFTVEVTPTVTLLRRNKVVKLADLKEGDLVTVE